MKKAFWLIQSNQVTPTISAFLKLFQTRMDKLIDLSFIIPDTAIDVMNKLKDLNPSFFKLNTRTATKSHQGYLAKREILNNEKFSSGLTFTDTLLLDDLGGGNVIQTTLGLEKPDNLSCLILQIPTPLGSYESEERVFHAAVLWAAKNQIPVIGYELLPLDTRWNLAASLPDGVITRYQESYDHLKTQLNHTNLWQLPFYESSVFSSVATQFNLSGVKASYHHRTTLKIPESKTVLYLPHNVAMIYEYQELLRLIAPLGENIHLMFGYGKDQIRGAYTQKQMVQIIYKHELKQFFSHSFHNMNSLWEMLMADSLVSCSACFHTMVAQEKNIPSIIFDPMLSAATHGFKHRVNHADLLLDEVKSVIANKAKKTELGTILMQITRSMPDHA